MRVLDIPSPGTNSLASSLTKVNGYLPKSYCGSREINTVLILHSDLDLRNTESRIRLDCGRGEARPPHRPIGAAERHKPDLCQSVDRVRFSVSSEHHDEPSSLVRREEQANVRFTPAKSKNGIGTYRDHLVAFVRDEQCYLRMGQTPL